MRKLKDLEKRIGYQFKDKALLEHAVRHSSYVNEKHMKKYECNERLEFLGDAVLELVSSEYLFFTYRTMPEGELTKKRASMVCEPSLAFCARDIELGEYLRLGKGEEATGGRKRDSVTSDAMEALIGAIYLDGGFASAKEFIHRFILNDLEDKQLFFDSKTILQEMVQASSDAGVVYELLQEEGPDHNKTFRTGVRIGGEIFGMGEGRTKKASEQQAAYQAILKLQGK
ncbi:ribonuclease III [Drancourtella sp. An177]|nr:ribonuclease III [Drancourtella sp. An177]